jgi:hypothetical protein
VQPACPGPDVYPVLVERLWKKYSAALRTGI